MDFRRFLHYAKRTLADPNPARKLDFIQSMPSRLEIARRHKEDGGLVAGVLPIHYPRSLLRAFNIHPIEVWGPPNIDPTSGAARLQPYVCSLVRNALSFLETGGMDVVDLILVPHACDSLQGLGSVMLDFVRPQQPVFPFYLPRGNPDHAVNYLTEEIQSLYRSFEKLVRYAPTNDDLLNAIREEEAADILLARLHCIRSSLPWTDYDFYQIMRSREYLPLADFMKLAQSISDSLDDTPREGIPIVLSGIVPEPMEILNLISMNGGYVAADDFASCGRRLYPRGESNDPFRRMAQRLLGAAPDWNKGSSIKDRLDYLWNMVEDSAARGVIFYVINFCEPELFDLPELRNGLQDRGIPSVMVEMDLNDALTNQVGMRIETFLEMIS